MPPSTEIRKIAIIGSGPAGFTAGIYAARSGLKPILFSGTGMGGQLMLTSEVENFPGFAEPILGPDLMDHMKRQCERLGVEIVHDDVVRLDLSQAPYALETTEGRKTRADTVIVATGASANWLDLPSEKKLRGHGVSACATCDGFFFKGKAVAVVGGGDAAIEEATFLTRFASKVTVVHRRDSLRASNILQERAFRNPKIGFVWNSIVEEVVGEEEVAGLRLKDSMSGKSSVLDCQGLFVAIGHTPNTRLLQGQLKLDAKGYLATDGQTRTSVPGVFGAGDVMDPRYRQAVTAAGTGCMAALEAERYLTALEAARREPS